MRTRPMSDLQFIAHHIYSIPCECDRSYFGETGRPLSVRIQEYEHNLKNGLLGKSKLAKHVFEKYHQVFYNEAKILHTGFCVGLIYCHLCFSASSVYVCMCPDLLLRGL
jgi:hypothetical protein